MERVNVERVVVLKDYQSNSYLVYKDNLKSCVIVDCGGEFYKIRKALEDLRLEPEAIILTHGHGDHIAGVDESGLDYYIHKDDRDYLFNPELTNIFAKEPLGLETHPV